MSNNQNRNIVIIPVYNEEPTINEVLLEVNKHTDADILVVNDGSTDNSILRIKGIKRLSIINHSSNIGYGQSLIDGFNFAIVKQYSTVVTIDCDSQHEPQIIPEFLTEINEADILSGSRYLTNFKNNNPAPHGRKRINREITKSINQITGFKLTDSFCGFKAYKVEALKRLSLSEQGYGMPLQLWIQAWVRGFRVQEKAVQRIYSNPDRTFGEKLDNDSVRLEYYKQSIDREIRAISVGVC